jgi:hypothetical protein
MCGGVMRYHYLMTLHLNCVLQFFVDLLLEQVTRLPNLLTCDLSNPVMFKRGH